MRRTVLLVVLGLALAAASGAASAPDGFVSQPALATRAAYVAGKPVTVWCTPDQARWNAYVREILGNAAGSRDTEGFAPFGGDEMYLSPDACAVLNAKLRGGPIPGGFGRFVLTTAHEAEHLRGLRDEGETDCAALAVMPAFLRAMWGIKKPKTLARVMEEAHAVHGLLPPQYRGGC